MHSRCALAVLVAAIATGSCSRVYDQQPCRLEGEDVLAITRRPPAAIAIARIEARRYLAAWSADGESRVAWLDEAGRLVGPSVRLSHGPAGAAADAGPGAFWPAEDWPSVAADDIDISALGDGRAAVVLLESAARSTPRGVLSVLVQGTADPSPPAIVGLAGAFTTSVDTAVSHDRLIAAWCDGSPEGSRGRLVVIDPLDGTIERTATIASDRPVVGVSVAASRDRILFAEAVFRTDGDVLAGEIRAGPVFGDLTTGTLLPVGRFGHTDPALAVESVEDGFMLAHRDDADHDGRTEYYTARLDRNGRLVSGPHRVSRADGLDGISLVAGARDVISATARTFQRNLLVGLNRLDSNGRKLSGEFQVYADKSDFTRVAIAPTGDGVLMIYAEDRGDSGRLLSGKVACDPARRNRMATP